MKRKLLVLNGALCLVLVLLIGMGVALKRGTWSEREPDGNKLQSEMNEEEKTTGTGAGGHSFDETNKKMETPAESFVIHYETTGKTEPEETEQTVASTSETEVINKPEDNKETTVETTIPRDSEETTADSTESDFIPGENELEAGGGL